MSACPDWRRGPDVDFAEHLLKTIKPKLFFINTVFHNPTATNVAPQVAFKLLQLAQQHDFTIVEDDIYADFQATPTQRLASLDQLDHVIYLGGLSKTIVIVAAHRVSGCEARTRERSRRCQSAHEPGRIAFQRMRGGGAARARDVPEVSRAVAAAGCATRYRRPCSGSRNTAWEVFDEPTGGNFIWARVPHIDDSMVLVEQALKFGITLAPGSYYRPNGESSAWVRINTAHADDPRALRFFEHMAGFRINGG